MAESYSNAVCEILMSDCLFCKIIAGEIPSYKIYEDEEVYAMLDISQATKGHSLVLPKKHANNLLEMSAEESAALFSRVPKIANLLKTKLAAEGMNIMLNTGEIAGQSVFHTHVHLLPRTVNDGGPDFIHTPSHDYDLAAIAKEILS